MAQERKQGTVVGVNGNLVTVEFGARVIQNEIAYVNVGDQTLKGEVIRVRGNHGDVQIYEATGGIKVGDSVDFTGELLSVTLGPGLLRQVYDGLQNPLPELAEQAGFFLQRGIYVYPLDKEAEWEFTPTAAEGDTLTAGQPVGFVPEGIFEHQIMLPFAWRGKWRLTWVADSGARNIEDVVAKAEQNGDERDITMVQTWPVRVPITAYDTKILADATLVTQQRIIDTFFPVAQGGTFCTPGPFGAGKTVLQHALARHAQIDVVIVTACGERAGEVVEILREYPELDDPRTGRSLMDRTIIVCNTSSMPVASREASIYTGITLAEYYRQMGLNALLLADSTSRWAQALRETSGRLEEIPGEEAYPAYLESRIAGFYERAGLVKLKNGNTGSVTVGGAVSPAGGNFEEPVTQATLKVVGCFLGLSRDRANARRYPAIDPLGSWSNYPSVTSADNLQRARRVLERGDEVNQMMKVVGEEGTPIDDFVIYLKSEFCDAVYLQQNTFDDVDGATSEERQRYTFDKVTEVLAKPYEFNQKDQARAYFQKLRQAFVDWNYTARDSDEFKQQEKQIDELIATTTEEAS